MAHAQRGSFQRLDRGVAKPHTGGAVQPRTSGSSGIHARPVPWLAVLRPKTLLLVWLLLVPALPGCGDPAPSGPDARTLAWRADVRPVLGDYCTACHSGAEPDGSLDLEPWAVRDDPPSFEALRGRAGLAERLASHVTGGLMPPPGEMRPEEGARAAFGRWWADQLAAAWAAAPPDPGRVTMRRLSRYEYQRTVKDLLGVDFDAAALFPRDDVGYGFDHIGDVLAMPPILFEKYLAAAETIAERAVWVYDEHTPRRYQAERLRIRGGGRSTGDHAAMSSNGEVVLRLAIGRGGAYAVRVRAWADLYDKVPANMALHVNGKRQVDVPVRAPRRSPDVHQSVVSMPRGEQTLTVAFTNDKWDPKTRRDRNLHIDWIEVQGPLEEGRAELPAAQRRLLVCEPTAGDERTCAQRIFGDLLRRAFRRPPTAVEVERHVGLLLRAMGDGETFTGALRLALQAVLVSPHFLFRVELDERAGPGTQAVPLDDHQLASRLAYFLWSTLPDDTLNTLADAGMLRVNLHEQVTRMLEHPYATSTLVQNFAAQWLELRRLETVAPDPQDYPDFDEGLRASMRQETELVVAALIREDRSILELIDWPYSYVDERLARHYGIEGVAQRGFHRVKLPPERGGILGHASILTLTSYPTRTSPVQRGKWLMDELLGTPPAPPPPGVGSLETQDPSMLKLTLRERLQKHREDPTCAVCHDRMDNLGYGLEEFDPVGALRTGRKRVDSSGVLPDGRTFEGARQLRAILRDDPGFPRCFAEKLLTYALGRGLEPYDRPAVLRIVEEARARGFSVSSFAHAVVASDAFTMRRSAGESR